MKKIMIALCALVVVVVCLELIRAVEKDNTVDVFVKNLKILDAKDFDKYLSSENEDILFDHNEFVKKFSDVINGSKFGITQTNIFTALDRMIKTEKWNVLVSLLNALNNPYFIIEEWGIDPNINVAKILQLMIEEEGDAPYILLTKSLIKDVSELNLISLTCYAKDHAVNKKDWESLYKAIQNSLGDEGDLCSTNKLQPDNSKYKDFLDVMGGNDRVDDFAQSLFAIAQGG